MEYMNGITENDNGWVNDDILVDEIIKTLNSTKEPDFTFGITVQSHGKYELTHPLSFSVMPFMYSIDVNVSNPRFENTMFLP